MGFGTRGSICAPSVWGLRLNLRCCPPPRTQHKPHTPGDEHPHGAEPPGNDTGEDCGMGGGEGGRVTAGAVELRVAPGGVCANLSPPCSPGPDLRG